MSESSSDAGARKEGPPLRILAKLDEKELAGEAGADEGEELLKVKPPEEAKVNGEFASELLGAAEEKENGLLPTEVPKAGGGVPNLPAS